MPGWVQGAPCTCVGQAAPKVALQESDRVFRGKVLRMEVVMIPVILDGLQVGPQIRVHRYTVQVQSRIKGRTLPKQITVFSGEGGGDCGFRFVIDKEYVIYGHWRTQFLNDTPVGKRFLYTDICTRTTGEVEDELGAIRAARRRSH